MAIKYLERSEIDASKWDACIESNLETASAFALHDYLDLCCEHWSALVLDDYVSVFPLPWRKKYFIKYIYPPFFTGHLGIFGKAVPPEDMEKWIAAIPLFFKWIDVLLHPSNSVSEVDYKTSLQKTFILDCSSDYQSLKKNYSENHKRNCKKSEKEQLKISHQISFEEIINLFRKNNQHFNVGYKAEDYLRLNKLLSLLQEKQQLEVWGVLNAKNELCAGAFFPFFCRNYYFLFSGRSLESTENKSMFFLFDNFIQQHANQNIYLEMSTNNPSVGRFYAGFGSMQTSYPHLQISRLNAIEKFGYSLLK